MMIEVGEGGKWDLVLKIISMMIITMKHWLQYNSKSIPRCKFSSPMIMGWFFSHFLEQIGTKIKFAKLISYAYVCVCVFNQSFSIDTKRKKFKSKRGNLVGFRRFPLLGFLYATRLENPKRRKKNYSNITKDNQQHHHKNLFCSTSSKKIFHIYLKHSSLSLFKADESDDDGEKLILWCLWLPSRWPEWSFDD